MSPLIHEIGKRLELMCVVMDESDVVVVRLFVMMDLRPWRCMVVARSMVRISVDVVDVPSMTW